MDGLSHRKRWEPVMYHIRGAPWEQSSSEQGELGQKEEHLSQVANKNIFLLNSSAEIDVSRYNSEQSKYLHP